MKKNDFHNRPKTKIYRQFHRIIRIPSFIKKNNGNFSAFLSHLGKNIVLHTLMDIRTGTCIIYTYIILNDLTSVASCDHVLLFYL